MYRSGALSTDLNGHARSHWVAENHVQEKPLGDLHLMIRPHLTFPPLSSMSYSRLLGSGCYTCQILTSGFSKKQIPSGNQTLAVTSPLLLFLLLVSSHKAFLTWFRGGRNPGDSSRLPLSRYIHLTPGQRCSQCPITRAELAGFVLPRLNVLFWLHSSFLHGLSTPRHGQNAISRFEHWEEKRIHGNQSRSR